MGTYKEIHHSNGLGGKLQNLMDSKLYQLQVQDSYKPTLLGNTCHRKVHLQTDSRQDQAVGLSQVVVACQVVVALFQ
jgi:hypothetical protein